MKPKNKIVSVFDDIGVKVATEMIEEQCCFLMAPSLLCSLEQACAPFANDPAPNLTARIHRTARRPDTYLAARRIV